MNDLLSLGQREKMWKMNKDIGCPYQGFISYMVLLCMTSLFLLWSTLIGVAQINASTSREEAAYIETTYAMERGITWALMDMKEGHEIPASLGHVGSFILEDTDVWFVLIEHKITGPQDKMVSHYIVKATHKEWGTMCSCRIYYRRNSEFGRLEPIRLAVN